MITGVTRATADDAAELSALCAEHARYERARFDADGHRQRLAAALAGPDARLHAWIARVGDHVVGYATATIEFSTWAARDYTHMDCLFVRDGHRGSGVGKRLMDAVRQFALSRGHDQMQWQTPDWNLDAARFYRRGNAVCSAKLRFVLTRPALADGLPGAD